MKSTPVLLRMALLSVLIPSSLFGADSGRAVEWPRVKATMSNLRTIGTAVEAWAIDHGAYPSAATIAELANLLEPAYIKSLPMKDAWGSTFLYAATTDLKGYRIVSAGADQLFEENSKLPPASRQFPKNPEVTTELARDIVYENGGFLRYPKQSAEEEAAALEKRAATRGADPLKATMGDIRSLAVVCESYAIDNNHYPKATDLAQLKAMVTPTYISVAGFPLTDGWGGEYRYVVSADSKHYRIVSAGADRNVAAQSLQWSSRGSASGTTDDIVFQDGQFVSAPATAAPAAPPTSAAQAGGATAGWRTWTAPGGGFSVDLPDEPVARVTEKHPGSHYEIFIGRRLITARVAGMIKGDVSESIAAETFINNVVSGFAADQGQLVETHVSDVAGSHVRHATIDFVKSGTSYRMLAVFSAPQAHTLAIVMYTAPVSEFGSRLSEATRVVSSLKLLPAAN